jgi:hypothetical protein
VSSRGDRYATIPEPCSAKEKLSVPPFSACRYAIICMNGRPWPTKSLTRTVSNPSTLAFGGVASSAAANPVISTVENECQAMQVAKQVAPRNAAPIPERNGSRGAGRPRMSKAVAHGAQRWAKKMVSMYLSGASTTTSDSSAAAHDDIERPHRMQALG